MSKISIDEELFDKMMVIVKLRNKKLHAQIKDTLSSRTLFDTTPTIETAREIKTNKIKERIKLALKKLLQAKEQPTKYKVHKVTNISYVTLKKYYDDILDEVENEG